MPIALGQIKDLLQPGLMAITGKYEMMPSFYNKLFAKKKSTMALERSAAVAFVGLAQLKTEGAATMYDNNAGQRFIYNMETKEFGLGYVITRKAIDDNLYKTSFQPTQLGLNDAFHQAKEREGAAVFNNAFTYNSATGGDGKALCATDHPYDGGAWANRPSTDYDLNEGSLLSAQVAIRSNFVNERGLKIYARSKLLVVPNALQPVAIRLLKSELRPGTANNDVNAILHMDEEGLTKMTVYDYLTSSRAWFIKTNIEGLIHLERVGYETDMQPDFDTDSLKVKGYERYGFFYNDPRALYGSNPTS